MSPPITNPGLNLRVVPVHHCNWTLEPCRCGRNENDTSSLASCKCKYIWKIEPPWDREFGVTKANCLNNWRTSCLQTACSFAIKHNRYYGLGINWTSNKHSSRLSNNACILIPAFHQFLCCNVSEEPWTIWQSLQQTICSPVSLISTTQPLDSFSSSLNNDASKSRSPGFWSLALISVILSGLPVKVDSTSLCLRCRLPLNLSICYPTSIYQCEVVQTRYLIAQFSTSVSRISTTAAALSDAYQSISVILESLFTVDCSSLVSPLCQERMS